MKSVIIVGAGIAGLSSAIRCASKGLKVCVLEQGLTAGGVSTSWDRKGYHFEGGIHWLVGSTRRIPHLHRRWKELGALRENNPISFHDPIYEYRCGDVRLTLWTDIERNIREMTAFSPDDSKAIRRFWADIRQARAMFCAPASAGDVLASIVRVPAFLLKFPGILSKTTSEYCSMFKSRHLQGLISSMVDPAQNAISLVYTMACYVAGDNGYPKGGSIGIVRNMLDRAKELGIEIRYRSKVDKVCVSDAKVRGVLCGGEFYPADEVIVASDTVMAVEQLFDRPIEEPWVKDLERFSDPQTCMFLSLGIEAPLKQYERSQRIELQKPVEIAGTRQQTLFTSIYHDSTGYAPEGCCAMTVIMFGDSYTFWKNAKTDGSYREKKAEVIRTIISELEACFPEIEGKVAVTDLATPLTYERYCGTHRGAWMSIWHKGDKPISIPGRCKSIKGLHFAGFRTLQSGGLPIAMGSGYRVAATIKAGK